MIKYSETPHFDRMDISNYYHIEKYYGEGIIDFLSHFMSLEQFKNLESLLKNKDYEPVFLNVVSGFFSKDNEVNNDLITYLVAKYIIHLKYIRLYRKDKAFIEKVKGIKAKIKSRYERRLYFKIDLFSNYKNRFRNRIINHLQESLQDDSNIKWIEKIKVINRDIILLSHYATIFIHTKNIDEFRFWNRNNNGRDYYEVIFDFYNWEMNFENEVSQQGSQYILRLNVIFARKIDRSLTEKIVFIAPLASNKIDILTKGIYNIETKTFVPKNIRYIKNRLK